MLERSPETFYEEKFLNDETTRKTFEECMKLEGWRKNTVSGYKLNRETIVFVSEDILYKLKYDNFQVPTVWGKDVTVLEFPTELKLVKEQIEKRTGWGYNIALGNRYLTGKDKIAFHSDNEEFGNTQSIASISLGVSRQFSFIEKESGKKLSMNLSSGSLLFMGCNCQENYIHGMVSEKVIADPDFGTVRINVTFRVWNY